MNKQSPPTALGKSKVAPTRIIISVLLPFGLCLFGPRGLSLFLGFIWPFLVPGFVVLSPVLLLLWRNASRYDRQVILAILIGLTAGTTIVVNQHLEELRLIQEHAG